MAAFERRHGHRTTYLVARTISFEGHDRDALTEAIESAGHLVGAISDESPPTAREVDASAWRAPRGRLWAFASTSRAGSTWLAHVIDRGSPLRSAHEHLLNHRVVDGRLRYDQHTTEGFRDVARDETRLRSLVADVRGAMLDRGDDLVDANPYLAHALHALLAEVPDATVVHLHRDPWAVLRSILNRQWYDTPLDTWHPDLPVEGWSAMRQLERCAWYVRHTNELLLERELPRLAFESVVHDVYALAAALDGLGIPFFPSLAADAVGERRNENPSWFVAPVEDWCDADRALVDPILEPIASRLGYATPAHRSGHRARTPSLPHASIGSLVHRPGRRGWGRLPVLRGTSRPDGDGLRIEVPHGRRAALVLGPGRWSVAALVLPRGMPGPGIGAGWPVADDAWVRGALDLDLHGGVALLVCVSFDRAGRVLAVRRAARWFGSATAEVAIRPRPDATRFTFLLVLDARTEAIRACVRTIDLELVHGWDPQA
jgi:hypothetical protein